MPQSRRRRAVQCLRPYLAVYRLPVINQAAGIRWTPGLPCVKLFNMPVIYLMRHGRVHNPDEIMYGDLPGFHLSEEGVIQAQKAGDCFVRSGIRLGLIVSSPLERAAETAQAVASVTGAPLRFDERLTEWGNALWAGKKIKEFDLKSGYYAEPMVMNGMEPHERAAQRVLSVMHELKFSSDNESVLLVSHREALASAILNINRRPFDRIHDVRLPMGSVWEVVLRDGLPFEAKFKWEF